jgi:FHS family L-fucose permease-like MFS transporter
VLAALLGANKPGRTLGIYALFASALVFATTLFTGMTAVWAIIVVGLFNSIMFPTIFALAVSGLGPHTSQGSGALNTAIVGGAIVPLLMGALADSIGLHSAFILPALCYLYIAFYGFIGSVPQTEMQ